MKNTKKSKNLHSQWFFKSIYWGQILFDDHQWYSTFCTSTVDSYLASQLVGIFEKRPIKTGAIVFRSWGNSCTFLFQLSISRILHSNYSLHAYSSCLSVKPKIRVASISFIPAFGFHHKNQIWGNSSSSSSSIYFMHTHNIQNWGKFSTFQFFHMSHKIHKTWG